MQFSRKKLRRLGESQVNLRTQSIPNTSALKESRERPGRGRQVRQGAMIVSDLNGAVGCLKMAESGPTRPAVADPYPTLAVRVWVPRSRRSYCRATKEMWPQARASDSGLLPLRGSGTVALVPAALQVDRCLPLGLGFSSALGQKLWNFALCEQRS